MPKEPFGQAGVRQYIGRILAWVMLTLCLASAAMAQRSGAFQTGYGYYDEIQWRSKGQGLGAISAAGQISLFAGSTVNTTNESGWRTRGGYMRDFPNRGGRRFGIQGGPMLAWQTDLGRLVGFEVQTRIPNREFSQGFLFRFKWLTLAALFMLQPLVYVLLQLRRRRVEARGEA